MLFWALGESKSPTPPMVALTVFWLLRQSQAENRLAVYIQDQNRGGTYDVLEC